MYTGQKSFYFKNLDVKKKKNLDVGLMYLLERKAERERALPKGHGHMAIPFPPFFSPDFWILPLMRWHIFQATGPDLNCTVSHVGFSHQNHHVLG